MLETLKSWDKFSGIVRFVRIFARFKFQFGDLVPTDFNHVQSLPQKILFFGCCCCCCCLAVYLAFMRPEFVPE